MDILGLMYPIFREKYSKIMDEIEAAIFVFVEELILSKNIPVDETIDYESKSYQKILRELVDTIAYGLKSLNIPEATIINEFTRHYRAIMKEPSYSTYIDWITYSFQPKIQRIIFIEVVKYLLRMPSVLKEFVDYSLLTEAHLATLDMIRNEEENMLLFLDWFFRTVNLFEEKIRKNEQDYAKMLTFADPEIDLQSFYIVYRITEILGIVDLIDFLPVRNFLINNLETWTQQNTNISEKYPMTLYCGVYLAKQTFTPIDNAYIKNVLKKLLVRLVNNFKCPIYEDTFFVSYILRACEVLNLKLTQKIIAGIARYNEQVVTSEFLHTLSTARLSTIYSIYQRLGIINDIPMEVRKIILEILEKRKKDGIYLNYDFDFLPSSEAVFGSLNIEYYENQLQNYPFMKVIEFLCKDIKENLNMLDFGITGQLSDIYYGIKSIELMSDLTQNGFKQILNEFFELKRGKGSSLLGHKKPSLFATSLSSSPDLSQSSSLPESVTEPSTSADQKAEASAGSEPESSGWDDLDLSPDALSEGWKMEGSSTGSEELSESLAAPSSQDSSEPSTSSADLSVLEEEKEGRLFHTQSEKTDVIEEFVLKPSTIVHPEETQAKRPLPKRFWDFFGDFPTLITDIVDELRLNIPEIIKVRPFIFDDLQTIHQWVTTLKILNIEFPLSADEMYEKTAKFRKENGFGIPQSDYPDPVNTFYGLCVYSEFGIVDRLNLQAISRYLIFETNHFNENFMLTNDYIFMSQRLLERFGIPMKDYSFLIPRLSRLEVDKHTDQFNALTDAIHYINLIRCIDPNYDLSYLNDDFIKEVQINLEDDGSINKRASESARVLISLYELGLEAMPEGKFLIKYLQYDSKSFIDLVKEKPIGWDKDPLGYKIELNICYWVLLALTLIYPSIPPMTKAAICPECKTFFSKKPKFCNQCGHRFL